MKSLNRSARRKKNSASLKNADVKRRFLSKNALKSNEGSLISKPVVALNRKGSSKLVAKRKKSVASSSLSAPRGQQQEQLSSVAVRMSWHQS